MKNWQFILLIFILISCDSTSSYFTFSEDYNNVKVNVELLESGEYKGSSVSDLVLTRNVIGIPKLNALMKEAVRGEIVVQKCINQEGDVTFSKIIKEETTIADQEILIKTLKISRLYKYEKDIDAPAEQCGKFTFKLDVER